MHGLAIFGITGRMGPALLRALRESAEMPESAEGRESADRTVFRLSGAVASGTSGRLGQDAAGEGAPSGVLIT